MIIRQSEKLGSNSSLYNDTKKWKFFEWKKKKNIKIIKREYTFKGYASTYNVNILNSFNAELLLKNAQSEIIAS